MTSPSKLEAAILEHIASNPGRPPAADAIVSRDSAGSVLSRYNDLRWDLTPYTPHGRASVLNFAFWGTGDPNAADRKLVDEMHWVMFLAMWRRPGPMLSFQTLYHYVKLLRAVALHCVEREISLRDFFQDEDILLRFVVATGNNEKHAKVIASLLSLLGSLGSVEVGFVVPGQRLWERLRVKAREYVADLKQHPPLPTRIYAHVLGTLLQDVSDFEGIANRYFELAKICLSDHYAGRSRGRQYIIARAANEARPAETPSFESLLAQFDSVASYLAKRGFRPTVQALSSCLYDVQLAMRLTVQAFTGMRSHEAALLPLDCLREEQVNGKTHYVLEGATSKLNRGRAKRARWVTSREGARAVRLAQRVARFIERSGFPEKRHSPGDIPLFVSTGYVRLGHHPIGLSKGGKLVASHFDMSNAPMLRARLQVPIVEVDVLELEQIDPHRAWRSEEEYAICAPWTLTSHQLRRSLALYAHRSGLVSLPSLKRQLQHITEDMARYYARGSTYARDFIGGSKTHFGYEWQSTAPVSAALSYIVNVLLSEDVLFGGHANWIDHRLRGADGQIVINRDKTIELFRKGELAYRETPLGGCTSTAPCDRIAVRWLDVDCVSGCKNLVGRLKHLERVISAQSKLVSRLDPATVEYRSERADLDVLIETRDRVAKRQSVATGDVGT